MLLGCSPFSSRTVTNAQPSSVPLHYCLAQYSSRFEALLSHANHLLECRGQKIRTICLLSFPPQVISQILWYRSGVLQCHYSVWAFKYIELVTVFPRESKAHLKQRSKSLPIEYSPTRYSLTSDLLLLCTVSRALNRGLHPDWIWVEHISTNSPIEVITCRPCWRG